MNNPQRNDERLAQWAHQMLGQLPDRRAPSALAPRILAAVAKQRSLPWYRLPWHRWPATHRILSATLMGAAFVALWWFLLPRADTAGATAAQLAASQLDVFRPVTALGDLIAALGNAAILVLRGFNTWVIVTLVAAFALMWTATLGLGTACWRMATGPGSTAFNSTPE